MTNTGDSAPELAPPTPDEIARMVSNLTYQARNYEVQGITPRDLWGNGDDA